MNKKSAMSAMGYAIVSVIILGIVMIVSAPMLVNNVKEEKPQEPQMNYEKEETSSYSELRSIEERLSSRIDNLERRQSDANVVTDKYVCSIEGKLDENGEVVPVDSPNRFDKFVFVCEYRR